MQELLVQLLDGALVHAATHFATKCSPSELGPFQMPWVHHLLGASVGGGAARILAFVFGEWSMVAKMWKDRWALS
jgi:hypothetical protein